MYVLWYDYLRLNINSSNILFAYLINHKILFNTAIYWALVYKTVNQAFCFDYFIKSSQELCESVIVVPHYLWKFIPRPPVEA